MHKLGFGDLRRTETTILPYTTGIRVLMPLTGTPESLSEIGSRSIPKERRFTRDDPKPTTAMGRVRHMAGKVQEGSSSRRKVKRELSVGWIPIGHGMDSSKKGAMSYQSELSQLIDFFFSSGQLMSR
jgi:hypothetical protein